MTNQATPTLLCSAGSLAQGEPLYASIKPARFWVMLEVDEAWGAKAFPQSSLSEPVKGHVDAQMKALKPSRLLLIRQQPRQVNGGLRLFLAEASLQDPVLYEFQLPDYMALLDLDLVGLAAEPARLEPFRRAAPLFLVCTNGKRDPCCAANGLPVYRALSEYLPLDIWQTSHVGGHRFSANLACMPHALFYGRVPPERAPGLARAYQHNQMDLEYLRGRGSLPEIAQAAEYFLRRHLPLSDLNALELLEHTQENENLWRVRFRQTAGGAAATVRISVDPAGYRVLSSCRDAEPSDAPAYHLLSVE